MFVLLAALAALAEPSSEPARFSDARPPARFQGPATVTLQVTDQAGIDRVCHPLFGKPPAGMKTDACQFEDRVVLPDPCTFPESDRYAAILCHELGHANGWSSLHERDPSEQRAQAPRGGTPRVGGAAVRRR